jgi:hypothetical protein
LSKVSAEESALLRAAIIEALGNIGGDHAGTALKTIAYLERKRNNYEMTPRLITAFKSSRAPTSVRDLCELYVDKPDPNRLNDTLEAIKALAHMASLDPARVADRLQRLVVSGMTHRDVAAAAVDALDEIQSAGGT